MDKKIFVPLITPLDNNRQVCEKSVVSMIDSSRSFCAGYVPCLTSGEGWLLTDEQWQAMVSTCVAHAKGHIIIAGIEKPASEEVIKLARQAESLGAQAVMITTPFGQNVSQESMYEHFKRVHDDVGIDVYVYNENSLSNNVVEPETLLKIANLPRVVGIKESMNLDLDPSLVADLRGNGIRIYQGWENRIVNDHLSDGNICSLSNLFPELCLKAASATSDELVPKVDELCQQFGIYKDSWYSHIKSRLFNTDVISTDLVLA